MKILLCAYACEPNRGSEPGIGWKWGYYLALYTTHEVYVLTRLNNKKSIESYINENKTPHNLHFFYYDLPPFIIWLKHHGLSVNIYYSLWLYGASKYAQELNQTYRFNIAHHITFGVFRDASFLYKLHIPYIIGPVGGGECTPPQLYPLYPFKHRIREHIRTCANHIALINPFLIKTLNRSSLILCKTQDTKQLLKKWESKIKVQLELGVNKISYTQHQRDKHKFLYVGHFIPLKGIKLILESFLKYVKFYDDQAQITFIGKGIMETDIIKFSQEHKLEKNIQIIPWIEQDKLKSYYTNSYILLFPSLHDSSGNVVLEALSNGLPVISLDCGGPASIQGPTLKDMIIATKNKEKEFITNNIVTKMQQLTSNPEYYYKMQQLSLRRANEFIWNNVINAYEKYLANFKS